MASSQFLFIHDTVHERTTGKTERDPNVAKAIRTHLQHHNRKAKLVKTEIFYQTQRAQAPIGWRRRSRQVSTALTQSPSPLTEDEDEEQTSETPGPSTILQDGNSDPFHSFSVPITARVNQILQFYQRDFLQIPYTTAIVAANTYRSVLEFRAIEAANDRNDAMIVLRDEFCASGFLLAHMTILSSQSQDAQMLVDIARLKTHLYTRLQARIETKRAVDEVMVEAILQLFNAAVYAGNLIEAKVHGKCLLRLLKQQETAGKRINIVLLFRIAYTDISLAATMSMAPIMNDGGWVANHLIKGLLHLQREERLEIPELNEFFAGLDACIPTDLRTVFAAVRRLLWIWWTRPASQLEHRSDRLLSVDDHRQASLYRWLYAQIYVQSYALVEHLAKGERDVEKLSPGVDEFHIELCVGRTLATALLSLISASCGKILDISRPTRPGTHLMLANLHRVVERTLCALSTNDQSSAELQRSLLWACFVGSMIDHLHSKGHRKPGKTIGRQLESVWHEMVTSLGLTCCDHVEMILSGFVYYKDLREAEECRKMLETYLSIAEMPFT